MRYLKSAAALLIIPFFSAAGANASECGMDISFDAPAKVSEWRAVNDGVMGGLSDGAPEYKNGAMIFSGNINTNGGGFSSIRTMIEPDSFKDANGMTMRVKADGRKYEVTMRTNASYWGRPISFQIPFPETEKGKWEDIDLKFEDMEASIFGREVRGTSFAPHLVWQIGIIFADGQDGPFKLKVKNITSCPGKPA